MTSAEATMNAPAQRKWLWAVISFGVVYLVTGVVSSSLAKSTGSNQLRVAWRLAAWAISGVAFLTHISYDRLRLRNSSATVALHVSLAVAFGAFGLAVAASLHGRAVQQHFPLFALAVWPLITAIPAFIVALAVAAVLARIRPTV
jgi:hypothetical protein